MDLISLLKEDNYLCRSSDITVSGNDTIYKMNDHEKLNYRCGKTVIYLTVSGRV
ncbi:hypothetical protein [Robinsoniella sp. KNHs210]|uniref:hypothetical protein n=1 Tax=Robinsoniella sp. KNHs210 TaxID=1469950 RepID=UPI0012DD1AB5|nr:hypothetical protein [Robinsoniella sp. KNHs210]